MSLRIERWARQALRRELKGDHEPVASRSVLGDVNALGDLYRQEWLARARLLRDDPTALNGVYAGLNALPPAGVVAVTSINGETNVPPVSYTPIPTNSLSVPQGFRFYESVQLVTVATPASLTVTPRIGTTSSGATLGASSAITLTASITTNYYIRGDLTVRAIGPGATGCTMVGFFHLVGKLGTTGAGVADQNIVFGHTAAAFQNDTAAQALWIGAAHTVTTITHNVQQVMWGSWN